MKSIRTKLLIGVLSIFTISVLLLAVLTYRETMHEIEEVFDAELAQTARMISQMALANIDSKGVDVAISSERQHEGHRYEKHISYQVWYRNALVLRSDSAPSNKAMSDTTGYQDVLIGDQHWRVFGLYPESSSYRIYTAEDHKARDELTWEIVIEFLGIYLWSIPVLGLLIYLTLNKGLSSLEHLSEDVHLRDVDQLKPFDTDKMPSEVLPLVNALNELLERLDAAIARERRFTSDASHELRTPLSSIRLHAQNAMNSNNNNDRNRSLEQIISAVDQSTHLAEQMLTLARLDPENFKLVCEPVNPGQLIHELISEMNEYAKHKNIKIVFASDFGAKKFESNHNLLKTILRNLLDNAIRYSDENSTVNIDIRDIDESKHIVITDSGPGIPDEKLDVVTERFHRLAGQEIDGCGLGLSIAGEAANRLGGKLQLANRGEGKNGLQVTIVLPQHC